jgi:thiamine biosynthesis lipoprotein
LVARCALLVVVVLFAPLAAGAKAEERPYERLSAEVMTTRIDVIIPREQAEHAKVVFDTFARVDARMSEWKPTSPLAQVNAEAGEPVAVPDDLRAVVRRGLRIGELTEGAFDITWAALWGLWDFNADAPRVPSDAELRHASALVDFRSVAVDDVAGTVRLPRAGMKIGLGGIAKGHALDRSAAALRERGVTSFTLSAGGQVYAAGRKGDRPWRVGIRDPRGGEDDFFAVLEVSDLSVSTSGDYERFFVADGVRYHHILDPRTGRPARGLRSATVVARDATLADALSTAVMVLGRDRGLAVVEGLIGVEAVVVDDAGRVATTSGLVGKLEIRHPPTP